MASGVAQALLWIIGPKVISGVFVSLLVTSGLLMAPVTCLCGADAPHGHSLFQLPSHHHGSAELVHGDSSEPTAGGLTERDVSPLAVPGDECDDPERRLRLQADGYGYVALGNVMEKQDSAVPHAPGTSSTAQLTAIPQSVSSAIADRQHESPIPTTDRALEGMEPAPETPPPRIISS